MLKNRIWVFGVICGFRGTFKHANLSGLPHHLLFAHLDAPLPRLARRYELLDRFRDEAHVWAQVRLFAAREHARSMLNTTRPNFTVQIFLIHGGGLRATLLPLKRLKRFRKCLFGLVYVADTRERSS